MSSMSAPMPISSCSSVGNGVQSHLELLDCFSLYVHAYGLVYNTVPPRKFDMVRMSQINTMSR